MSDEVSEELRRDAQRNRGLLSGLMQTEQLKSIAERLPELDRRAILTAIATIQELQKKNTDAEQWRSVSENLEKQYSETLAQRDDLVVRLTEREQKIEQLGSTLEAISKQTQDIKAYGDAAKFWSDKANLHKSAGSSSLTAFLVFIAIYIAVIAFFWKDIVGALPKTSSGEVGLVAVAVIFFVLGPVLWLLRLLARFSTQHFSLTQDASERETMMRTFLSLVGHSQAKIKDEERLLVLGSIFRPAAGASDDGVSSSFVDTIQKAIEGAIKK